MNRLQRIAQLGQSIWYDNISRDVILGGQLQRMVDEGLLGVTSNPTIFDKAISSSTAYDAQIADLLVREPEMSVGRIIQRLMVTDIRMAADVLRPVYDRTARLDGYVSIEVTPSKAHDTAATVAEARELWKAVDRPNVMIKIPATAEGLPAIEQTIAEGININVTLIFSTDRYRQVADAYLKGLERRLSTGQPLDQIASVASVFVSRIDTLVDDLLAKRMGGSAGRTQAHPLAGKSAVANSKMVYRAFKDIFFAPRSAALQRAGASLQRPLWGSTGTKNPVYSDLLYVDTLIGPHTVNTVPPATYAAILDHSVPELTLESDVDATVKVLDDLRAVGIDMSWVLQKLEDDGVAAFEKSFDGIIATVTTKREQILQMQGRG
jgi:transaldolase